MEFQRLEILLQDKLNDLRKLKVLILGVGGVGGSLAIAVARMGINEITLVDYDKVDITNINRQVVAFHSTIGKLKVDVLKDLILDINPSCNVLTYPIFYNEANKDVIFNNNYDYILDCCDSIKSKEIIIRESVKRGINVISSMGAGFKFDPSMIEISKLKNTSYDKLAKILRYNLKDNKDCLNIRVVYSKESIGSHDKVIGSNSIIPNMFGLYMASIILNDIKGEANEKI